MNDLNTTFLLDIWHDLKEKRLAPVAVALVVALIAMPALLMRGGGEATDVPLPLPVSGTAGDAEVVVAEELRDRGSKLDSYKAHDPFAGVKKTGSGAASAPSGSAGAPAVTGPGPDKPGAGSSPAPAPSTPSAPSAGGGSTPSPAPPPASAPAPEVKRETAFYNFRLDVKFGKVGREKRYASLSRMGFLMGGKIPIALFLGVTEDLERAIFLVYPGLNHQGEGECVPKPTRCVYVALEAGKEHYFSAADREYRMELRGIKRVKASKDKRERDAARKSAQRRAQRAGDDGGVAAREVEQYDYPLLVDGVG